MNPEVNDSKKRWIAKSGTESSLCFPEGEPRTTKKVNHPTRKWTTFGKRWTTKAVRMTREMRRRCGAMTLVDD